MAEWEIECRDCGWRGTAAERTEVADDSGGSALAFCPDCGGSDFEKHADTDAAGHGQAQSLNTFKYLILSASFLKSSANTAFDIVFEYL